MARSIAIIGAGQIGLEVALSAFAAGWRITICSRTRPAWSEFYDEWRPYTAPEDEPVQADFVVDTIAFDAADIERYDPKAIERLIVISSASVYRDAQGRTLDEATANGWPEFGGPIREDNPTVAPGPETYSTRKMRMERAAQDRFGERATLLRPCAIYGRHSRHPREWWFVKRLLDGRTRIPLTLGGRSRFQTTWAHTIGLAATQAFEQELGGVYNVADRDAPNVLEIGEAILEAMRDHPQCKEARFEPIEDAGLIGRTPWSVGQPMVVSGAKLESAVAERFDGMSELYARAVQPTVRWLCECNPAHWRTAFPQLAAYPWDLFDYATEDRFFDKQP
ncbi:MAG: reductase [Pseudomonadota bacterium]